MDEREWLAERFEGHRLHLQAVAVRMLGTVLEADDAVQEAWLRLSRSDVSGVHDLGSWLTTVVGRVCLDKLRARRARREEPLATLDPSTAGPSWSPADPAAQAELSDSVGLALLVVLETLEPAERLAFVLHDIFALPFAEIAPLVERSTGATKMLASRARRRVQDAGTPIGVDPLRQRSVVRAFLAASRHGDFEALLALLDPDVVFRADHAARQAGAPTDLHGADSVAQQFAGRARAARLALVDGVAGAVWARGGKPAGAFAFDVCDGRVLSIDLICDPDRLARLDLQILEDDRRARTDSPG